MITGSFSLVCERYGQSSELSQTYGAIETGRLIDSIFSAINLDMSMVVSRTKGENRNSTIAQLSEWVSKLDEECGAGVAFLYIGLHAFEAQRGILLQFGDSAASQRELTGLFLEDILPVFARSKSTFVFLLDCCRTGLQELIASRTTFFPENCLPLFSIESGMELPDHTETSAHLFIKAIGKCLVSGEREIDFLSIIKETYHADRDESLVRNYPFMIPSIHLGETLIDHIEIDEYPISHISFKLRNSDPGPWIVELEERWGDSINVLLVSSKENNTEAKFAISNTHDCVKLLKSISGSSIDCIGISLHFRDEDLGIIEALIFRTGFQCAALDQDEVKRFLRKSGLVTEFFLLSKTELNYINTQSQKPNYIDFQIDGVLELVLQLGLMKVFSDAK